MRVGIAFQVWWIDKHHLKHWQEQGNKHKQGRTISCNYCFVNRTLGSVLVALSFRTQSTFEMTDGFIAGCLQCWCRLCVFSPHLVLQKSGDHEKRNKSNRALVINHKNFSLLKSKCKYFWFARILFLGRCQILEH